MAIHSSTIAWKIPWTEEPGWLQSMGSQRVGHAWATSQFNSIHNVLWTTDRCDLVHALILRKSPCDGVYKNSRISANMFETYECYGRIRKKTETKAETGSKVYFLLLYLFFWPVADGILIPPPVIKPRPQEVEVQSPNHWTTRGFPYQGLFWLSLVLEAWSFLFI